MTIRLNDIITLSMPISNMNERAQRVLLGTTRATLQNHNSVMGKLLPREPNDELLVCLSSLTVSIAKLTETEDLHLANLEAVYALLNARADILKVLY